MRENLAQIQSKQTEWKLQALLNANQKKYEMQVNNLIFIAMFI